MVDREKVKPLGRHQDWASACPGAALFFCLQPVCFRAMIEAVGWFVALTVIALVILHSVG